MTSPHQRFQSFDDPSHSKGPERIAALRAAMREAGVDGFVVPRADEHQSEYVPPNAERLAWLTGFTGSAGTAVVLADAAALVVDGRYTLQAPEQVDTGVIAVVRLAETTAEAWIGAHLGAGLVLGYDPWLHTADGVARLERAVAKAGGSLRALDDNLVDAVWAGRPLAPSGPVVAHPPEVAGEGVSGKLARVRAELAGADALVISDPHNLAWAFNLRGRDVAHTPLALGYAILPREGRPALYLGSPDTDAVRASLDSVADLHGRAAFEAALDALARDVASASGRIRLDAATGAAALKRRIEAAGAVAETGPDPITAMKAVKNPAEIAGTRAAHHRDGIAVTRFLAWLDRRGEGVGEIEAVEALEAFRAEGGLLKEVSFPTISGSGPNGAIVHYRVSTATDRRARAGELFLVDSGAQYLDGTTDITRTVAVGPPSEEMRDRFTRVLKGHIAIARAVFPKGTTGAQLDSFARAALWEAGLDFDHGTGHGVGAFLSVHEGPQRIAKTGTVALVPGMILSNEPGYYRAGAYGIRIENLVLVEERTIEGGERPMLGFETLTLSPIDRRLILPALLGDADAAWLDAYHARVRDTLSPELDGETRNWLVGRTRPITDGRV